MSGYNCCFLSRIQVSQETDKVVWYSHLFKNFPHFVVFHTLKGFHVVNDAEVDVLLELPCFFYPPANVIHMISGSSAFSKFSLNILKFSVHVLLKPSLKEFEHYHVKWVWLYNILNILWHSLFWGVWNENCILLSCGHCWVFQICWHNGCSNLIASHLGF